MVDISTKILLRNFSVTSQYSSERVVIFCFLFTASGVVQIAESHFRNGANDVRLVVSKTDGSSEEVSMTVNIERDPPPIQPSPLPGHTTPAPLSTLHRES